MNPSDVFDLMVSSGYEVCTNCYTYFYGKKTRFCSKDCEVKFLIRTGELFIGLTHAFMTRDEITRYGVNIEYF